MPNNKPGCLLGFFKKPSGKMNQEEEQKEQEDNLLEDQLPYKTRDDFLSKAELSFYRVLLQVVKNKAIVCPKVSLSDIFFTNISDRSWQTKYYNKIARKHIDFLICSPDLMHPLCGIELDDSSHQRFDRAARDAFVDKVFDAAGLELFRFENKRSYTLTEIQDRLNVILEVENPDTDQELESKDFVEKSTDVPICSKCNIPMVMRMANKGAKKGQEFYGCKNYPKCRETRS